MSDETKDNDRADLRGSSSKMNEFVRRMAGVLPDEPDEPDEQAEPDAVDMDGGAREHSEPLTTGQKMDRALRVATGHYRPNGRRD